jgi:thiol:disulfide interchange protein DsbA
MKQSLLISIALLFLIACGQEEAAQPAAEAPAVAEEQVTDEVVDTTADAEEVAEEIVEVVEESAAEPDAEEQAILLAQADVPVAPVEWQFKDGQHYIRLVPTQPTVGGADKIEVAEFFWYGCGHCYDFESSINQWDAGKPANVRFVRVPAMWNDVLKMHAQLYYTEEVLVRNGVIEDAAGFRSAVFEEYHRRGNRLLSPDAISRLFERYGVSSEEFTKTWGSFEVSQKLRVANDLARRYTISSVPTVVVNGKYRTGAAEAGSYPKLIEVIDELIARESTR